MYIIRVETVITAPIERCFDLARSVDAHIQSAADTGERAVAGRTEGLLELGDQVTWQARHFGIRQHLTSVITEYDRPNCFRDRMTRGAIDELEHDHIFTLLGSNEVLMLDVMRFHVPFSVLGQVFGRIVMVPYMRRFLRKRGQKLKEMAESNAWRSFLPENK